MSQSDPKTIQITVDGPLKTYGIYGVRAMLSHSGRGRKSILILLGFLAPVLFGFGDFPRLWRQYGAQNEVLFSHRLLPNSTQGAHNWPLWGPGKISVAELALKCWPIRLKHEI